MNQVTYYWHNGRSLGHTFESAKFIRALLNDAPGVHVSAVTGAFHGTSALPAECDLFKLPGFRNFDSPTGYRLESRLELPYKEVLELRRRLATEYLLTVRPDVLVVNHELRGYEAELHDALVGLGSDTRRVLSMRGVMMDYAETRREYFDGDNGRFLLDHYDLLQVHIDPDVFDLADYYRLPKEFGRIMQYVGYPDEPYEVSGAEARHSLGLGEGRTVVAAMGGGQGAGPIWSTLLKALLRVPGADRILLFPGPYLEPSARSALAQLAVADPRVRILDPVDDLRPYLAAADLFVGAAGASTISEVLACRANALLVSRQLQEKEQEIHAQLLARHGHVRALRLEEWTEHRILTEAVSALDEPRPLVGPPALGGARRSSRIISSMLPSTDPGPFESPSQGR